MTKYGLRARVLAFTILPTLIIGGLMAGYFTFHRYQQLENNLIDQGSTSSNRWQSPVNTG